MATKTISIDQLRVGMYDAKIDLTWFQSPFIRRSLLIENADQIDKLRRAGARHLVIDLSRGDDVETSAPVKQPPVLQEVPLPATASPFKPVPKPLTQLNEEYAQARVEIGRAHV